MVDIADAALGASITWGVTQALEKAAQDSGSTTQSAESQSQAQERMNTLATDGEVNTDVERALNRMNEREERLNPPADAMQGWYSTVINDLSPGGTSTVTIQPTSGWVNAIKRIEFTMEDNHAYDIRVGGRQVATGHKWVGMPTEEIGADQKVVARVTNNTDQSGVNDRTTTIDFEAQLWGWATQGGHR